MGLGFGLNPTPETRKGLGFGLNPFVWNPKGLGVRFKGGYNFFFKPNLKPFRVWGFNPPVPERVWGLVEAPPLKPFGGILLSPVQTVLSAFRPARPGLAVPPCAALYRRARGMPGFWIQQLIRIGFAVNRVGWISISRICYISFFLTISFKTFI